MRKILISVATAVTVLGVAPMALAGERADAYYTVVCDGVAYESVDARAVEQGGRSLSLSLFPRADCTLVRPFDA